MCGASDTPEAGSECCVDKRMRPLSALHGHHPTCPSLLASASEGLLRINVVWEVRCGQSVADSLGGGGGAGLDRGHQVTCVRNLGWPWALPSASPACLFSSVWVSVRLPVFYSLPVWVTSGS